jgi:hypothetical protein
MTEKKPGPAADRLKLKGDWKQSIRKALAIKRPQGGWPKQQTEAEGSPPRSTGPKGRSR